MRLLLIGGVLLIQMTQLTAAKEPVFTGDYLPHRILRSAPLSGGAGGNEAFVSKMLLASTCTC